MSPRDATKIWRRLSLSLPERGKRQRLTSRTSKERKWKPKGNWTDLSPRPKQSLKTPPIEKPGPGYVVRIKEIGEKQTKLTEDLENQKNKVEEYKMKLRSFTDEIEKLKKEQGEMVAEFVSNQQVVQLEDRLRGLGESAIDESIVAIREKVAGLRHQAKIAAEMRGAALETQDAAYERMGSEREAAARFDELLKARAAAKAGVPAKERDLG